MVFEEVLLLPKPCSTRKAPRRSDGRKARGTCTTPESLRPAEGMVTASSVIGMISVGRRDRDFIGTAPAAAPAFRLAGTELAPARVGLRDVVVVRPHRRREAR